MFELDAYSKLHHCRVLVSVRAPGGLFTVISSCEVPGFTSTKHLLYDAVRRHFDVLEPALPAVAGLD